MAALAARVDAADTAGRTDALSIFDLGYALEAISEIENLGHFMGSDLAARGRALAGMTRPDDGRALMLKSASLRGDDAGIAFALALIEKPEDKQPHLLKAARRRSRIGCWPPTWPGCRCCSRSTWGAAFRLRQSYGGQ